MLMMIKLVPLIIVGMLVACTPTAPALQHESDRLYFKQTGHAVTGDFAVFFTRYGGLDSFGYPLTEPFDADGWTVQYFEKGRLEYHPENEPAYRVTAGWLGERLRRQRPPVSPAKIPTNSAVTHRYFLETGHTLAGDFLRYFEVNGGTIRFGYPISEPFLLNGQITQDFQSARFFWNPQKNPPIILEDIGRFHFQQSNFDNALLLPEKN